MIRPTRNQIILTLFKVTCSCTVLWSRVFWEIFYIWFGKLSFALFCQWFWYDLLPLGYTFSDGCFHLLMYLRNDGLLRFTLVHKMMKLSCTLRAGIGAIICVCPVTLWTLIGRGRLGSSTTITSSNYLLKASFLGILQSNLKYQIIVSNKHFP